MGLSWRRGGTRLVIRHYEPSDEPDWLVCHALIDRRRQLDVKPTYAGRSAELVAASEEGEIVGFLDVEIESEPGALCWRADGCSGFVHELGVLREYRQHGLARRMVAAGVQWLRGQGVRRLELWATDDGMRAFAEQIGCRRIAEYRQFDLRHYGAKVERLLRQSGSRPALYFVDMTRLQTERSRFTLPGDLVCTGFELSW